MTQEQQNFIGICITAGITLLVALINLRQNRAIKEVHVLVNSRLEAAMGRIMALEALLAQKQSDK